MNTHQKLLPLLTALVTLSCGGASDPTGIEGTTVQMSRMGDILFMTQRVVPTSTMEALYVGGLTVDERGCIRLDSPGGATVIWPRGYSLFVFSGMALVRDESGDAVGVLDGDFSLGGGEVPQLPAAMGFTEADRALAANQCPGLYWIAS